MMNKYIYTVSYSYRYVLNRLKGAPFIVSVVTFPDLTIIKSVMPGVWDYGLWNVLHGTTYRSHQISYYNSPLIYK